MRRAWHFRAVPDSDIGQPFIQSPRRAGEQEGRDREAEHLCGLKVDHQLEVGRRAEPARLIRAGEMRADGVEASLVRPQVSVDNFTLTFDFNFVVDKQKLPNPLNYKL
jgi:hypothetical protein